VNKVCKVHQVYKVRKFIKFIIKMPPLGEDVLPPRPAVLRGYGRDRWGFYPNYSQQPPTTPINRGLQLPPREECFQS